MTVKQDMRRYQWSFIESCHVNFWWWLEHLGYYRGGNGGLFGYIRRLGYRNRKQVERRTKVARATWAR